MPDLIRHPCNLNRPRLKAYRGYIKKNIMKKIFTAIGTGVKKTWQFFTGKKRLIAIACGLVSQVIPKHTAVGQTANWLQNNLDYVNIGLEVIAGLFGATALFEHGTKSVKKGYEADKLPSLITKVMDKIPDKYTGVKGSANESGSGS